jgi:hypothetical protein
MPNPLFEQHLQATMPGTLKGSDTALLDEESNDLIEVFKLFASGIDEGADLGDAFDGFCEYFELEPSQAEYFSDALGAVTEDVYGEATDEAVRSFLDDLNRPYPKANETSPNKDGMTPLPGELAIKRFLKSLTVQDNPDPYGNQGFSASKYKAFNRSANRYGVDYSYDNDFNNQKPSCPLANPILNVAFEAVDSVGINAKNHWKVVNTLTGEYVTRQMTKEEAVQIATDLNDDFIAEVEQLGQQQLQESYPTRKHFQQVANEVRKITDGPSRQAVADHHARLFAQQNPRFDHDKFHSVCGTQTKKQRGIKENTAPIASTAIQENILKPLSPQFIDAFKKANQKQNFTMAGSPSESSYRTDNVSDWKAAQTLINEQRKKQLGEPTEQDAITAQSQKGLRKKK